MKKLQVGQQYKYKTIMHAIKDCEPGDTLLLEDERYFEKVVVNKEGVTIDGQNKAEIIYNDYAEKIHEDGRP